MDNADQTYRTLSDGKHTGYQVKKRFKDGLEAFQDKSQGIVLSISGYMRAFTYCIL